tara:strand:+ start:56 stop:238 length:183 start_codon:yes stop_codon:yes gene_type:complete
MKYTYEIEWRDNEGDIYSESFTYLPDARKEIKYLEARGNVIVQTWRYLDGEYLGSIPPRQ